MSSYYDDASLMLLASGGAQKDGKVYSVKPTDGSGDFTFTRGSNLAATRVDAAHLIEKGRENLLLQSNQFDTTWVKSAPLTLTSGQSGYDSTSDAWKLESNGASGFFNVYQSITISGVNTYSIYAKAGTNTNFALRSLSSVDVRANFNLSAGSVSTSGSIDASIVLVGNGWYRCSVVFNGSNNAVYIYPNYIGVASSGYIYIQDAQVEQGLVATDYIPTTTTTGTAGILEDTPRFDYTDSSCPSLLLESQRTNVVTDSEYFDVYTKSNVAITNNDTESPEGVQNATSLSGNGATSSHFIYRNFGTATSGIDYTFSFFAKKGSLNYVQFLAGSSAFGVVHQNFDLENGTIGSSSGSVIPFIESYANDWYRVGVTITATASATITPFVVLANSSTMSRLASFATSGDVKIFGYQIEAGSYPTSYIPTYGTSVTRAVDDVNQLTSATSLIGQSEGTLFLDFVANDKDSLQIIYQVRTTGNVNVGQIDFRIQSGNLKALGNNGGANQFNISAGAVVAGTRYKCAVRYANNDVAFYVNGVIKGTDTSASFGSSSLNQIGLNENTGLFFPSVSISQSLVFPTALTDLDLAILTGATTYNTFAEMAVALNYTVYE